MTKASSTLDICPPVLEDPEGCGSPWMWSITLFLLLLTCGFSLACYTFRRKGWTRFLSEDSIRVQVGEWQRSLLPPYKGRRSVKNYQPKTKVESNVEKSLKGLKSVKRKAFPALSPHSPLPPPPMPQMDHPCWLAITDVCGRSPGHRCACVYGITLWGKPCQSRL